MGTIHKILIANRGEIACRVIQTCKQLHIDTVAVYTDKDQYSRHAQSATYSIKLQGNRCEQSYLDMENIIAIAKKEQCDAIHPGYGFLSENPDFAQMCQDNNIIFIGPSAYVITQMGSKNEAKKHMATAYVPTLSGYHGDNQSNDYLIAQAKKIGFPILIKAAYGGGGKGMRIVYHESELEQSILGAKREAMNFFKNDKLLLEQYLQKTRHIEIQVFCDKFKKGIYLFDRDCSIQRRYQKIIEEAPAFDIPLEIQKEMGETAVRAALAINYEGAGTVEFLLDDNNHFYFLEMNTRLQVEHPVTEMITQLDLVALQIQIAQGDPLSLEQADLVQKGHAIEARIYAENPYHDFLPSIGVITDYHFDTPSHIRVDHFIQKNTIISEYYDPLIAKVIAHGKNREEASQYLRDALNKTYINGIHTNIDFIIHILNTNTFKQRQINTTFLDSLPSLTANKANTILSHLSYVLLSHHNNDNLLNYFRINHIAEKKATLCDQYQQEYLIHIKIINTHSIQIYMNEMWHTILLRFTKDTLYYQYQDHFMSLPYMLKENIVYLSDHTQRWIFSIKNTEIIDKKHQEKRILAPMNGTIVSIFVKEKENVHKDQPLITIEAMKMEYTLKSPQSATILHVPFLIGMQVEEGQELIELDYAETH